MKKNLLEQVKEDLKKRGEKNYDLLYTFMALVTSEFEQLIRLDGNKLYINEHEICNLDEVTNVKQIQEVGSCTMVSIQLEKLDINTGVIYETKIVRFDVFEESYCIEDWIQNPNYDKEVQKFLAEQQYISEVKEGEMAF